MRIDAINANRSISKAAGMSIEKADAATNVSSKNKIGISTLAFKGGNEKHLFHQISEMQLFGQSGGGVGTVGNDLFFFPLSHNDIKDFDRVIENIPLYNQELVYVKEFDKDGNIIGIKPDGIKLRKIPTGLPADHPFKPYEGQVFTTSLQIGKDVNLADELAKTENFNKVFIVDEIGSKTMDWGLEKKVPISQYILRKDDKVIKFLKSKGWSDEQIKKIDITLTYVDSTASMAKPYADGSYSSATGDAVHKKISSNWQGKPYVKETKATAELLPLLKEKIGFDPKYITCHDGQTMPLIQFIAEKNANGIEYYKDKILTAYGHNLCDGYMYELGTKDAIIALAKPGEIERIINSKQYKQAIIDGKEDAFLKKLLPKEIFDGRGQINAVMFPIAYGEKGYVPMFTTVSHNYYQSIIDNELLSPALHKRLKALSEQGVFRGIINVLMDPLSSGLTTDGLQEYYKKECKIKTTDGKEITFPKFEAIQEDKRYDLDHLREVKRRNKISLLKRLNKDYNGAQLWGKGKDGSMQWLEKGTGYSAAVTGGTGRKFEILSGIKEDFIKMLEEGKDVPMFVSWGRGDFQKGMDTDLEAWTKFVKKTGDKNSVFILGGDMASLKASMKKLIEKYEKDPDLKGRFVCLDGWAPGSSFAAAGDYAPLASRFAPCELTDLESMKKGCIPIVPKVQGMDQKVFDPSEASDKIKFVNGYKGQHEFYMTEEEAVKLAKESDLKEFNKVKNSIITAYRKDYKTKIGEEMPDELLQKYLKSTQEYTDALRKLRDAIISDEMADSMERAIKDRNSDIAKRILKNHMDLKTTWEENGWCSPNGKSTAQLVRELHYNSAYGDRNLKKGEELKLDLSKLTSSDKEDISIIKRKLNRFLSSKSGKWTAGILAGGAIISGLSYIGYKTGWLNPKFTDEKKPGNLSCIG